MNPEHPIQMQDKALATLARTDGIQADSARWVKFEGERKTYGTQTIQTSRGNGQYVIVRKDDEVVAVYKVVPRFGPAKPIRTESGNVAFQVDSMSIGLKRMKRIPKGLV